MGVRRTYGCLLPTAALTTSALQAATIAAAAAATANAAGSQKKRSTYLFSETTDRANHRVCRLPTLLRVLVGVGAVGAAAPTDFQKD